MIKQAIGFSNIYYTLWTIITEPVYITDVNGKNWLVGNNFKFNYHKNISIDLDKAHSLYPGLEFHDDLKGKTQSWVKQNTDNLCPNIITFGKYKNHNIDDIINTDFDYIIWMCNHDPNCHNSIYAKTLTKVISYYQTLLDIEVEKTIAEKNILNGLKSVEYIDLLPTKNLSTCEDGAYLVESVNDLHITLIFPPNTFKEMEYNGFVYALPTIDNKAKRIKNKPIRVYLDKSFSYEKESYENNRLLVSRIEMIK